jgi:carboxypeptidase Taq
MTTQMAELRRHMAQIDDLATAAELLDWDQTTKMPPDGAGHRAEVAATVESIRHERLISSTTERLLEAVASELDSCDPDSDDARIVRQTRRRYEKASRVPTELAEQMARSAAQGHEIWVKARATNDFKSFAPHLQSHLELVHRYIGCFDRFDNDYDVLLDDFDPGLTVPQVNRLFDELKQELTPLIARLRDLQVDASIKHVHFPIDGQRRLVREVVGWMGFSEQSWRLDDTAHPFASPIGQGDTRITNRYEEDYFPCALYGGMHECGHGLYDSGVAPELSRTPVGHLSSLTVHESQSRLWENMVGRSREFCGLLAPRLQELSGGSLAGLDSAVLFRAVNEVEPSLIRIEADETTYALHVVVRFEIEQQLIAGRLEVDELPDAWNSRMHDYLGVEVPSDTLGVLQDVHWSAGLFGYFPTYALGTLIAAQLWERAGSDIPELQAQIAAGQLSPLREWLREHVHRHGSKFDSTELLERTLGTGIEVQPFVRYLKTKLSEVYDTELG